MDWSDCAQHAAKKAVQEAKEAGEPLYIVSVVDVRRYDDPALSSAELPTIYAEDEAFERISELTEYAEAQGVSVKWRICRGIPHDDLLREAEAFGADILVLGEHGDHEYHIPKVKRKIIELSEPSEITIRIVESDEEIEESEPSETEEKRKVAGVA